MVDTTQVDGSSRPASPILDDFEQLEGLEGILELAKDDPALSLETTYEPAVNAVHMEMQENAKLPTFNWNVDRTNSSHVPCKRKAGEQYSPTTQKDIEEMMIFNDNDFSLSEVFLRDTDRSSMSLNYITKDENNKNTKIPVSEPVQQSNFIEEEKKDDSFQPINFATIASIKPKAETTVSVPMTGRYRSQQLPIPNASGAPIPAAPAVVSPPIEPVATVTSPSMSTAPSMTATQSALAMTGSVPQFSPPLQPTNTTESTSVFQLSPSSATKDHSARHLTPSASIVEATKHRARFGFGGNHVVPSVPLPPNSKPRITASRKALSTGSRKMSPTSTPPSIPVNGGAAYERKKQRAKDARVRLNESIERLSVSITLAGTQTRQRLEQCTSSALHHICQECIHTAESAKKWDRPSFVGTAASLIQGLNAQCEGLMKEIEQLRKAQANFINNNNNSNNENNTCVEMEPSSSKRRKLNGSHEEKVRISLEAYPEVLSSIAKYLDPATLVKCQLSRRTSNACREDDIWTNLCLQRFGSVPFRQWRDTCDEGMLSMDVYREMDASNVSPWCSSALLHFGSVHEHSSNAAFLGQAKIPGKVSTWVSLVERSNGETFRSVQRKDKGVGMYTSMPVVELQILIQNTGSASKIGIQKQQIVVDASTRRRGDEFVEIDWDNRLQKQWQCPLSATSHVQPALGSSPLLLKELQLYESILMTVYIHARGCSTISKFRQRANYTQVLITVNDTTVPLVIPFVRESK